MPAYYNENDPFAAQWLRNLISAGHIAPGDVDARSIVDVKADDLEGYEQAHFFAGIGGWSRALRLAGWADNRPVWTGSCPCQPFSAAGALERFTDERHLWPTWVRLIEQRSPATILGEQVAGATEWLRLVRGDLEALGYAVGAIPIEAASAGADHLRDRFWFVGDYQGERRGEGRPEYEIRRGRDAAPGAGRAIDLANNNNNTGSQGRPFSAECYAQRFAGADGVANPNLFEWRQRDQQPAREQSQQQQHSQARDRSDLGNTGRAGTRRDSSSSLGSQAGSERQGQLDGHLRQPIELADTGTDYEWVIGADGKARRVKPGIRLLVDGFPHRVGLLRGFGNAIDPRPAAAFIKAALGPNSPLPSKVVE